MSAYDPPSETIGVFNSSLFTSTSENITQSYADTHYLKFPTSQSATETITSLVVNNDATINGLTVGTGAGSSSTNTALGANALAANTTGTDNTALGGDALAANTIGTDNSAFGKEALLNNLSGTSNTAAGYGALRANTTGSLNTAVGRNVLLNNTASNNTGMGFEALIANTTGSYNTSVGHSSMTDNTIGTANVAVGGGSLDDNTSGSFNTAIGYEAAAGANPNTTGSNNTYVGYQAKANASNYSNSTALGAGATITASNQVVLGTLSEKVVIPNQIQVSYSSLPTFDSTSIGYTASFTLATLGAGTGSRNTSNTSIALPVGVYMCHLYYKIDVTYPTTTRTVIEFDVAANATLVNEAIIGFVYSPAVQQYNYYSFPAILKITANPCSVFSRLTSSGGNCLIDEATLAVVRIA